MGDAARRRQAAPRPGAPAVRPGHRRRRRRGGPCRRGGGGEGVPRAGGGPLQQPAERRFLRQGGPQRRHWAGRRAGLRGRHEAADPRRRGLRQDRRRLLQDLWLRLRHRVLVRR